MHNAVYFDAKGPQHNTGYNICHQDAINDLHPAVCDKVPASSS